MTTPTTERGSVVRFFVAGTPIPQGSMRAVPNSKTGRVMLTSTSGANLKHWRDTIGWEARQHCSALIEGPVWVSLTFRLTRPKSAPKKRLHPTVKPDLDKLARAGLDAMTSVVYGDDSQVVSLSVAKHYCAPGEQPGVSVEIRRVE